MNRMFVFSSSFVKTGVETGMNFSAVKRNSMFRDNACGCSVDVAVQTYNLCFEHCLWVLGR